MDNHVHACPHINERRLDAIAAVREASSAGMAGIGLMDNFSNSAGIAALIKRNLSSLGVDNDIDVFGGLIMEPAAGGISLSAARAALDYGYSKGDGARFISLPTHTTRHVAKLEGRKKSYIESCFGIDKQNKHNDPLPAILDLIAERDIVFNTGHLSEEETITVVDEAKSRGVERILVPANTFDINASKHLSDIGATLEFSFFSVSHATRVGLTHIDSEKHFIPHSPLNSIAEIINLLDKENIIISSDCGVDLLPPPVEGLRCFAASLFSSGIPLEDLSIMMKDNPVKLFKVGLN